MQNNNKQSNSDNSHNHKTSGRYKELALLNMISSFIKENKTIDETLYQIALILPQGLQFPDFAAARIIFNKTEYRSSNYRRSTWLLKQNFITNNNKSGSIEFYYLKNFPIAFEGPFLKKESELLHNICNIISNYLDSESGTVRMKKFGYDTISSETELQKDICTISSKQLLQRFLNKYNTSRDIYHDLMPFKVKEILMIANLYDTYTIEKEGRFSEHMLGEYVQLNLTSLPRITSVSTEEEAFEQLFSKHFDLVIMMVGVDKKMPVILSERINKSFPYIPIFLLLNNNSDIAIYEKLKKPWPFEQLFVWNGESRIFFAMIKHVEDLINADNDTQKGLVRVILLVEDSPIFYSRYLPLLYAVVLEQTKRVIDDVSTDDLYKVLKLRARPKILLASNYEEALLVYEKYKNYLLCLITDVTFEKEGIKDKQAGFKLVKQIREDKKDLPVIIQSSNTNNAIYAEELKSSFIDKNSERLEQDFREFIMNYLGFGNFIYKNGKGKKLVVAKTLKDFEKHLKSVPIESILYHAQRDNFSHWLMARSEIQAAKILNPKKVADFKDAETIREYLISVIQKFKHEQKRGQVIPFDETDILDETNIVSITEGALGGKGRGLAFVNSLIYNFDFSSYVPNINIRTPKTAIIGTDEFENFLFKNNLHFVVSEKIAFEDVKIHFLKGKLSPLLNKRLKSILKYLDKPIAIRSSGLFEDSLMQPFAGIFDTYLLPNSHPDIEVRLEQLKDAIKLVYASVYSPTARSYVKAVNYKIEEEKMAIVIQEVVGDEHENMYYPHISGVAQSYNFYPFAHMKPEEGFAVAAFGLGKYVVEGEKAYRFSPKYPTTEILSPEHQMEHSQVHFYAVDRSKQNPNLLEGDTAGLIKSGIYKAEKHNTLNHCASVYSADNNSISAGLDKPGLRIINFANILKYNYIPLAKTIEVVLDIVKEALGSPVEIEFAIDLNKDKNNKTSFYLLQIKPLIGSAQDYNVNMSKFKKDDIILYSEKGMGNGLIKHIRDVIYIDSESFDKSKTEEMAKEIDDLNNTMVQQGLQYILIGPGRWGTRDRWIGIPVEWSQISNAKIIVETSLEGYPLDASSGSHFFHNVTSANVGYFSIQPERSGSYLSNDILNKQTLITKSNYFRHVRFDKPVKVRMDGKKRISVITTE